MIEIQRTIGQFEYAKLTINDENSDLMALIDKFEGLVTLLRSKPKNPTTGQTEAVEAKIEQGSLSECSHKALKQRGMYEYCQICGSRREIMGDLRGVWQKPIGGEK